MRALKDILKESILDDIDTQIEKGNDAIKDEIKAFLKVNYTGAKYFKISNKPNKDGLYEVSAPGAVYRIPRKDLTSLTNGIFIWDKVAGDFDCSDCSDLISLEGAPREVGGSFYCYNCPSLKSLKGAPKKVGKEFNCFNCPSLKSLKDAPKEVGGDFFCVDCKSLESLKGAPKEVGGSFYCSGCTSLKSLEGAPEKVGDRFACAVCKSLESLKGAPKEVGGDFYCGNCKVKFTEDDIKKVSNVKNNINF